ncbi:MAG: peptide ABC transporter substrate-binding protein [Solobacterium sp.]|nr:peptide ABC transporter substrate-binding protein [Solobacterium sp.]
MKFKKSLCALLAAALLAGCSGGTPSGGSSGSGGSGEPAAPKSITVAITDDLNTMDHHVATDGRSFIFHSLCIGGLAELDADGQPQPDLAEKWDVSEDGKTYTFHLRDGIKWSNGDPVTANDFVYSWRRLVDPALASEYNFIVSTINVTNAAACIDGSMPLDKLGVEATDDKTFVVHLDLPCGFLLGLMAFPSFFPLNQKFFEAQGDQYSLTIDNLLFCGPYKMTTWQPGAEYVFTKNPEYWNAANQGDYVDEVIFKFVPEAQTAVMSYKNGDVDVVTLTSELVEANQSDPGYVSRLQGYAWRLNLNQSTSTKGFEGNTKFQNLNLRKALGLSIDREAIAKDVLKDGSVALEGFIPKEFAYGPDGTEYRKGVGNLLAYDVAAAAEAYEQAKKELGGDVTVELLYEDSEASKAVAENIQSMWVKALPGITVNLASKTKKERLALMNNLEYEIGLTRWGPDYADPQTYLDLFKSNLPGYNNYYFNDEYDAYLDKGETGADAADAAARWADMVAAEKIIVEDYGIIPVYQNGGAMLINPKVTGIEFHSAGVDSFRHVKKAD